MALISGIGCSSRIPAYASTYGFHGVHGRALAVATGLAVSRPELTVLALGGDGDGFSIGGNHFLHACRRNVNFTYVVMDNAVYGMTKGQASPTTEPDWHGSKLTPDGTHIASFRPLEIALSAGAGFIARGFSGDPNGLAHLIAQGIEYPGSHLSRFPAPGITYRPEQMEYKNVVQEGFEPTDDRRQAFIRLLDDDHMTTGVVYRGRAPAYQPDSAPAASLEAISSRFAVDAPREES